MIDSVAQILRISPKIKLINKEMVIASVMLTANMLANFYILANATLKTEKFQDFVMVARSVTHGVSNVIFWFVPFVTWMISLYFNEILDKIELDLRAKWHSDDQGKFQNDLDKVTNI